MNRRTRHPWASSEQYAIDERVSTGGWSRRIRGLTLLILASDSGTSALRPRRQTELEVVGWPVNPFAVGRVDLG